MGELKTQKDKIALNKVTHSVRASQAVLQYGVGAMIDFPDQTLMTAAPEYWDDQIVIIHDERLEKALNVDYFGMPGNKDEFYSGISYVRFPEWYFCPKCRRFQSIGKWYKEYLKKVSQKKKENDPYMKNLRCMECYQDLVAARIVIACEKGHIDDFPWIKWVHRRNFSEIKPVCQNPELTFETGATATAGLEGLIVRCKTCGAKASLKDAFNPNIFKKLDGKLNEENLIKVTDDFLCTGNQPWKHTHTACVEYPRTMQRGASSIYFPNTVSSLVIPPYSDKVNILIEKSEKFKEILKNLEDEDEEDRKQFILKRLDKWIKAIALQTSLDSNVVKNILERKFLKSEGNNEYTSNSVKYKAEEYEALTGLIPMKFVSTNDFVSEEKKITEYDILGIKKVCLVKKVREVRALTGFTRIKSPGSTDLGNDFYGFVSSKEPETRWYPACEVRGEGIFLEFNSDMINEWILRIPEVLLRSENINLSYSQTFQSEITPKIITPKFILLHTLAHLLIKQLSFECGYTIASLRERIYCSEKNAGKDMSGILIYTASGDAEGTLGGLVRQGYSDALPRIFKKALKESLICSNDPVCATSTGQGRDSLNLAACHACTLLPETSCEEFNIFLDRGLVIGTFDNPTIGFFSKWLETV